MILKGQDGTSFQRYLNTLPENQRNTTDFNVYRYWELNGKPKDFDEAVKKRMFTFNKKDGYWHANSIAYNKDANEYEFMKSPDHPTIQLELDAYSKNKRFKKRYQLDSTSTPWKYVPRKQPGGILSLWQKAYDSKLGSGIRSLLFGQDYNLSNEEYLDKHGFAKPITGFAPLPTVPEFGPFQGIEYLTEGNFGTGAVYNAGLQKKLTKIASDNVLKKYNTTSSKWGKFLQKSAREQDDIVKYWNGERFKSMKHLQQYPKELAKFKDWILKHQKGGILKAQQGIKAVSNIAFNPYVPQEQQPIEFVTEIPEPYVPTYSFSEPQQEVEIAPLPEEQTSEEKTIIPTSDLTEKDIKVLTTDGTEEEKQIAAIKYLSKNLEITPEQAAGVIGIFTHESHFKLNAENKMEKEGKNENLKSDEYGIGINQWTHDRHHDFVRWVKNHGGDKSLKTQLDFAIDEIKTKFQDYLNNLRSAESVQDATAYTWMQYTGAQHKNFTKEYMYSTLIPNKEAASAAWLKKHFGKVGTQGKLERRVNYANQALEKYIKSLA